MQFHIHLHNPTWAHPRSIMLTGHAIKCYSCESVYDENCGEDFEVEQHFKLDCELLIPPRYLEKRLPPNKRNATGCLKRVYEGLCCTTSRLEPASLNWRLFIDRQWSHEGTAPLLLWRCEWHNSIGHRLPKWSHTIASNQWFIVSCVRHWGLLQWRASTPSIVRPYFGPGGCCDLHTCHCNPMMPLTYYSSANGWRSVRVCYEL